MRWHAPPPGAPTGVADYAERLGRAIIHPADIDIYHLGNNGLHAEIYTRAIEKPGIVVIHDAVLHHFFLGSLPEDRYIEEFVHNYGEWHRDLARELWRDRAASGVDERYFQYPMLRRAVETANAVIVHNPGAAAIARQHGAEPIHVIPHFFEERARPDGATIEQFRQRLGVAPGVTLFGIFGYLRETKRILPCLNAFRRLNSVRQRTALLLAGDAVSGDLRRLLDAEPVHPAIHRVGHLTARELDTAIAAVDCGLNLRFPAAGETSGIAIRLMGAGKPVILTEGSETSNIPESACLKVPAGPNEAATLFDQMALIEGFPAVARRIGEEARRHIQAHHSLETAASRYKEVIDLISAEGPRYPEFSTSHPGAR